MLLIKTSTKTYGNGSINGADMVTRWGNLGSKDGELGSSQRELDVIALFFNFRKLQAIKGHNDHI